jgi:predicted dehydrogenase
MKVKWGVLGTARIAMRNVIPAMQAGRHCEIVAIASRDARRAKSAAEELGIPKAYGSYEQLLEDPGIQAVYIPLPNHLHVPWSMRALEAGKHVLCEKPIGLSSDEARTLLAASRTHPHLRVMEAFMYRFHPQWQRACDLVDRGAVGELKTIQASFSYYNDDPANIRNQAVLGGGALMDIGCYCISLSRLVFGAEPQRVLGIVELDPDFQVDRLVSAILDFGCGTSTWTCATQLAYYQRVNIFGTEGRIEIEIPFNPSGGEPTRIWHWRDDELTEIVLDAANHYTLQGDQFSLAVLDDTEVPTPLEDAVANMEVIEAVRRSAERGTWV